MIKSAVQYMKHFIYHLVEMIRYSLTLSRAFSAGWHGFRFLGTLVITIPMQPIIGLKNVVLCVAAWISWDAST